MTRLELLLIELEDMIRCAVGSERQWSENLRKRGVEKRKERTRR